MTRQTMRVASVCWCTLFMLSGGVSQQQTSGQLEDELRRLGTVAESVEHSLPSLTCQEKGTSEWHDGAWHREDFTATLRARRDTTGTLTESTVLTTLNGETISNRNFRLPFYVPEGFDRALRYFVPSRQACYRYTLSGSRVYFETVPDSGANAQCTDRGLSGFVVLDADGNVIHLERQVAEPAASEINLVPFASMDFSPVVLNGRTFWLTSHMSSHMTYEGLLLKFEAVYRECRLFTATVKIGPATEVSPGRQ